MRKANPYRPPERSLSPRISGVDANREIDGDEDAPLQSANGDDIPLWQRDTISLSNRARRLIDRMKPALVRVLSFWDHHVTRLQIGERTIVVDGSGSYRID